MHDQIFNNDENESEDTGIYDKVTLQIFCVFCKTSQIYKGIWDKERKNFGIYCQVINFLYK